MAPRTISRMSGHPGEEIDRYLRTGEYDELSSEWPGDTLLERAKLGHDTLRRALIAEVRQRTEHVADREAPLGRDLVALTRAKVGPMVRGLFPRAEQGIVLGVLGHSVIFLTSSNIDEVLRETRWHGTAWTLANLYLSSTGAVPLSEDAPRIVGLSEETTCFVSTEYFQENGRFEDFIVHEAAHIFHNCKRRTIGLRETRRREWLLELEFAKRETFAYACEAYSRVLEQSHGIADRRRLLDELGQDTLPASDAVNAGEILDILREAVTARNGWKRILAWCSPRRPTRRRRFGTA